MKLFLFLLSIATLALSSCSSGRGRDYVYEDGSLGYPNYYPVEDGRHHHDHDHDHHEHHHEGGQHHEGGHGGGHGGGGSHHH